MVNRVAAAANTEHLTDVLYKSGPLGVVGSAGEVYILWPRRSGGKISRTEERREG